MPLITTRANASARGFGFGISAAASDGVMFPLQVVTVGGTAVSSISFTNIPSTYKHLQLRGIYRDTWTVSGVGEFYVFPNNDTSSSYSDHWIQGNGSSASAFGYGSRNDGMFLGMGVRGGSLSSAFGVFVIDILDYANTNKYKTARSISGADTNGGGEARVQSASWQKTTAISSLVITPNGYGFAQYSNFALYGIKGA